MWALRLQTDTLFFYLSLTARTLMLLKHNNAQVTVPSVLLILGLKGINLEIISAVELCSSTHDEPGHVQGWE